MLIIKYSSGNTAISKETSRRFVSNNNNYYEVKK